MDHNVFMKFIIYDMCRKNIRINKPLLVTFLITIVIVLISCSNKGGEENIFVQPINTIKYKVGDQLDYDKLKLVWADEFNTGAMVNTDDWAYETGYVRNNEIQYYTEARPENCKIQDGMLVVTGRAEAEPYNGTANYTSASIITRGKHSWKYGRFEIRAKVPGGNGPWPAFWAKGDNQMEGVRWPACGEVDIMEFAGRAPKDMKQNVIYGPDNTHVTYNTWIEKGSNDWSDSRFRIYSLDWNEKQITFAIDNKVTRVVQMSSIVPNPFNQKMFILINLALGDAAGKTMGGKLDPSCLPVEFVVDYVRIYQPE